jgi:K+-transporting ATPase ATPase C chain
MLRHLGTSLRITIVTAVIFGLLYPLGMTGLAQVLFPHQANGSMIERNGVPVGSEIIGQLWTSPKYFHGRPSAAGKGDDPTQTGGTNLAPSSKKLIAATAAAIADLKKQNPNATGAVPMDLVTSSASGIDPDISPEGAYYQAPRVAAARHLSVADVNALIARSIIGRTFGVLGEPRVNVLSLNLALDDLHSAGDAPAR